MFFIVNAFFSSASLNVGKVFSSENNAGFLLGISLVLSKFSSFSNVGIIFFKFFFFSKLIWLPKNNSFDSRSSLDWAKFLWSFCNISKLFIFCSISLFIFLVFSDIYSSRDFSFSIKNASPLYWVNSFFSGIIISFILSFIFSNNLSLSNISFIFWSSVFLGATNSRLFSFSGNIRSLSKQYNFWSLSFSKLILLFFTIRKSLLKLLAYLS